MPKMKWVVPWKMETPYDNEVLEQEQLEREELVRLKESLGLDWDADYTREELEEMKLIKEAEDELEEGS